MNSSFAITAQRQAVRHIASAVFTQVKSMFSVMRVLRIAIRDNHLSQTKPIEYWTNISLVVVSNIVQYDSLSVIEPNMEAPVLPSNGSTIDFERDAFWLRYIDGLNIRPVATF